MSEYLKTVVSVSIHKRGQNPIFGEFVTRVDLCDEAGGPFVELSQNEVSEKLRLDIDEIAVILEVAKDMEKQYIENNREKDVI